MGRIAGAAADRGIAAARLVIDSAGNACGVAVSHVAVAAAHARELRNRQIVRAAADARRKAERAIPVPAADRARVRFDIVGEAR